MVLRRETVCAKARGESKNEREGGGEREAGDMSKDQTMEALESLLF